MEDLKLVRSPADGEQCRLWLIRPSLHQNQISHETKQDGHSLLNGVSVITAVAGVAHSGYAARRKIADVADRDARGCARGPDVNGREYNGDWRVQTADGADAVEFKS